MLAAYRDATREPAVRAALGILLVDEARHAAAGRALLRVFTDGPLATHVAAALPALPALMAADRAELRARYHDAAEGGPGRALGACIERGDLGSSPASSGSDTIAVRPRARPALASWTRAQWLLDVVAG